MRFVTTKWLGYYIIVGRWLFALTKRVPPIAQQGGNIDVYDFVHVFKSLLICYKIVSCNRLKRLFIRETNYTIIFSTFIGERYKKFDLFFTGRISLRLIFIIWSNLKTRKKYRTARTAR